VTTYRDPRLADATLLLLAGRRLQHRLAQPTFPDWQETEGLCAILDYARRLPPCDPEAFEAGIYAGAPGLAGLLWEARQWQEREA
jgi:hypothetical protein